VWLELVPRKTGSSNSSSSSKTSQRLLPKAGGVIGVANCIMNTAYIDTMFHPSQEKQSPPSTSDLIKEEKKVQILKKDKEPKHQMRANDTTTNSEDPYAAMMFKIDLDIISTGGADPQQRNQLLSRTFRGLVADEEGAVMGPGAEVEMNLFIVDGDEGLKKSGVRPEPPRKDIILYIYVYL
jgi:hypothetical protein